MKQTYEEHLEWCKERAEEYLGQGDVNNAWASFASDMGKHEETKNHPAIGLGMSLIMIGDLATVEEMRTFILGFH